MASMTTAVPLVTVLLVQSLERPSIHTIPQLDSWRSAFDASSASLSGDGRYVAFTSYARLAPADTNSRRDVYVLDRLDRHVSFESVTHDGQSSGTDSAHPRLSRDGRFLVYETVLNATASEIVLRDRLQGTALVINRGGNGERANGYSRSPEISGDGRVVVFSSTATNLIKGTDANDNGEDIYAYEAASGTVSRISVDDGGVQPRSGSSVTPTISADGRFVAFASTAALTALPAPGGASPARLPHLDIFVRDRARRVTRRVGQAGRPPPDGASWAPTISADGRYVAFVSAATNLIAVDRNRSSDVFVADLELGVLELVSRSADGGPANGRSASPAISADARYVAFQSEASDMVCARRCQPGAEDINLLWDVFVRDRRDGTTARVSSDSTGGWMEPSAGPAMDASGSLVVFSSRHPINPTDTNNDFDLFLCARLAH